MAQELPRIQGHKPDSIQEVWLAEALDRYKIKYYFQFEISGGLRLRGGLIVDFHLILREEALEYYGDYWHEEDMSGEDLLRLKALEDYYGDRNSVHILWEHEAQTREEIFVWVKNNIL